MALPINLAVPILVLGFVRLLSNFVIAHASYRAGAANAVRSQLPVSSHGLDSFRSIVPRPDRLLLTFHDPAAIPDATWAMFRRFAHGFDITFANDKQCINSLRPFGDAVVTRFGQLTGAHRADLWRYCMLYRFGGVYLDIKTVLTEQLTDMFPDRQACYTVVSSVDPATVYQVILSVPRSSSVMRDAIVNLLRGPIPVLDYLQFCRQLFSLIQLDATDPLRIGRNESRFGSDWVLWREMPTNQCEARDRYGHCRLIAEDEFGNDQCGIRDPMYPWK